jgi:hypothetical protein
MLLYWASGYETDAPVQRLRTRKVFFLYISIKFHKYIHLYASPEFLFLILVWGFSSEVEKRSSVAHRFKARACNQLIL